MARSFREKYSLTIKLELEDGDYLLFREPTYKELEDVNICESNIEKSKALAKLFEKCFIDHNYMDDNVKTDNKEVLDTIRNSADLFSSLLAEWTDKSTFRIQGKKTVKASN